MLDLYANIKKYRKLNNMTQDQLAKLTGYTDRSSIAKIEHGDVDLPQSKIMLFAKALNVDPGILMGEIVEVEIEPDELDTEAMELLKSLPEEEKKSAIDYLKFLLGKK